MFNSRRLTRDPGHLDGNAARVEPEFDPGHEPLTDADLRIDELTDALAAELDAVYRNDPAYSTEEIARQAEVRHGDGRYMAARERRAQDPMQPVDVETGQVLADTYTSYDHWDDDALDQLAEELSEYDQFEPMRPDHGVLPPHPSEEVAAAKARRPDLSRTVLAVSIVSVLAAAAVGYAMTRSGGIGGYGDPVVVAAPAGPFKIVPGAGDTIDEPVDAGNVVFDPAAGAPPKGEERLLARDEDIPDLPGVTPQVNRVILPDGQEIDAGPVLPVDSGPRRVRTVLVRPDGTIIDAPDQPTRSLPAPTDTISPTDSSPIAEAIAMADGGSSAGLPPLPASEQVQVPAPVDLPGEPASAEATATPIGVDPIGRDTAMPAPAAPPSSAAEAFGDPASQAPVEIASAAVVDTPPAEPVLPAVAAPLPPSRPEIPAPVAEPAAVAEPAPAPAPAAPAAAAPAVPAPAPSNGPLDLTQVASAPAAPAPAAPAPAAPAPAAAAPASNAAAYVQLSSQRSEEAALSAFRGLQQRYPSLLGGLTPDVQRADLGAKGVYYRLRVPQSSRADANGLCASLKAAGSDCLIATR